MPHGKLCKKSASRGKHPQRQGTTSKENRMRLSILINCSGPTVSHEYAVLWLDIVEQAWSRQQRPIPSMSACSEQRPHLSPRAWLSKRPALRRGRKKTLLRWASWSADNRAQISGFADEKKAQPRARVASSASISDDVDLVRRARRTPSRCPVTLREKLMLSGKTTAL